MSKIVTASKAHVCTERSYHAIAPGDLYLRATLHPWHEFNDSRKFFTIRACLKCAVANAMLNDETRGQLAAKTATGGAA